MLVTLKTPLRNNEPSASGRDKELVALINKLNTAANRDYQIFMEALFQKGPDYSTFNVVGIWVFEDNLRIVLRSSSQTIIIIFSKSEG